MDIIDLGNLSFTVIGIEKITVGNKKKHDNVQFDWNFNEKNPLGAKIPYAHSVMRLWLTLKGSATVKTKFGDYELKEGIVYFFPPNSVLETNCPDYMEQFYIDFLQNPTELDVERAFDFRYTSTEFDVIYSVAKRIYDCFNKNDTLSRFIINTSITTILSYFIKDYKENDFEKIQLIIEYINNNINKKIPLVYLSNLINYSPEYFSVFFKNKMGISLQKYILEKRIAKAKILLLTTSLSVSQVSEQCGFYDVCYFSKAFKKTTGISPKHYKKY